MNVLNESYMDVLNETYVYHVFSTSLLAWSASFIICGNTHGFYGEENRSLQTS